METKEKNTNMKYGVDPQTVLYQLAREIREPISEMIASCSVITLGSSVDEETREHLERLQQESRRILKMIEEYVGSDAYTVDGES